MGSPYYPGTTQQWGGSLCPNYGESIIKVNLGRADKKKETSKMFGLKEYVEENRKTLWTILLIVIVDHFFLSGHLKKTIEKVLSNILNKTGAAATTDA